MSRNRSTLVCICWTILLAAPCAAEVVYVNNMTGRDAFDGLSSEPVSPVSGPVRTLRRAQQVAQAGATIVIENTGVPYEDSMQLVGPRHSGAPFAPFTVIGNGAVIDGSLPVPPAAWREVAPELWRMSPWRKGHYQLILDGRPVPEHSLPAGARALPAIPPGHWAAWRGAIYYQARPALDVPPEMPFRFAARDVGLTLYNVHDVQIVDVTFQHFRLDGVNAHDLCRNVVLENVRCLGNGRAGVAVGGTSHVEIRGGELGENRRHSLLITELGTADLDEVTLTAPATVAD